ncbi:MAG TPA: hypothetical protein VIZ28_17680 [Chitinophagaceae bacterium]
MENIIASIWIFTGSKGKFPGGVFTDKQLAEDWIQKHRLEGVLTLYPINEGVYDWSIRSNYFLPTKEKEKSPDFIGSFSSASQEHYHYLDGKPD